MEPLADDVARAARRGDMTNCIPPCRRPSGLSRMFAWHCVPRSRIRGMLNVLSPELVALNWSMGTSMELHSSGRFATFAAGRTHLMRSPA